MSNIFQQPMTVGSTPRNSFDLSHERKMTMQMGRLVPFFAEEVLPGDSFECTTEFLMRFAPLVSPVMHRMNVYTHFYFVPNRILWSNWEDFITGGADGTLAPAHPFINVGHDTHISSTIGDYLGYPNGNTNGNTYKLSVFPLAAYYKIYDDYYRDQNLQPELFTPLVDGDNSNNYNYENQCLYRAWEHDYFTSCLPFTQRGQEVELSITASGNIPVHFNYDPASTGHTDIRNRNGNVPFSSTFPTDSTRDSNVSTLTHEREFTSGNAGQFQHVERTNTSPASFIYTDLNIDNSSNLYVDLQAQSLVTVNDLRLAVALQQYLELNARGGSRYIETILVHFGVKSSDARLQRPEYLGGGVSKVAISEVLQTSESQTTPQGTMAGHGISVGQSHNFKKFFEEHGYIIGIMSVMPTSSYMNMVKRQHLKTDKLDYYWKSFAHLGEQEVYNCELQSDHPLPNDTFGYLPRYSEYKFIQDSVHGEFATTLDFWHMARKFNSPQSLNGNFIACDATDRIFAVQESKDKLWVHLFTKCIAKRPIPYFSTPSGLL